MSCEFERLFEGALVGWVIQEHNTEIKLDRNSSIDPTSVVSNTREATYTQQQRIDDSTSKISIQRDVHMNEQLETTIIYPSKMYLDVLEAFKTRYKMHMHVYVYHLIPFPPCNFYPFFPL